jgi:hypothetical protein
MDRSAGPAVRLFPQGREMSTGAPHVDLRPTRMY